MSLASNVLKLQGIYIFISFPLPREHSILSYNSFIEYYLDVTTNALK